MTRTTPGVLRSAWRILGIVVVLVASLTFSQSWRSDAGAISTDIYAIRPTSPTTDLVDGQIVSVNIKTPPDQAIYGVEVRQCRADATYTVREDMLAAAGKCPDKPISSSADQVITRTPSGGVIPAARSESGLTMRFRVGVGTVQWLPTVGQPPVTLTCLPGEPCALVVQVRVLSGYEFTVYPITFIDSDPIAGCGGPAQGVVSSGTADRLSDAWAKWTLDQCKKVPGQGAATRASFDGEGKAVDNFARGVIDLAYTAAGYDEGAGFLEEGTTRRPAVMVPIAVNAAVVAAGGGYLQPTGDKAPYPKLELTRTEIAAYLSGGVPWITRDDKPWLKAIFDRNPILGNVINAPAPITRAPLVPAEAESVSWLLTRDLQANVPDDWRVPFDGPRRGVTSSFALASPSFDAIDAYTGRPVLGRLTYAADTNLASQGPIWAVTDLVTATNLGMTPVSFETSGGGFVPPNAGSMTAALGTMQRDAQGVLLPDPSARAAASVVEPYPLTFVEYAMVPAEPLLNEDCSKRTDAQSILTTWLRYLIGDGQSNLPAGLLPLTAELKAEAETQLARVGASPVTGACAGQVTEETSPPPAELPPAPGVAPLPVDVTSPPSSGRSTPRAGATAAAPTAATPDGTTPPSPAGSGTAAGEVAEPDVPGFVGGRVLSGSSALLGFVLLGGLLTLATYTTAGRRPRSGSGGPS